MPTHSDATYAFSLIGERMRLIFLMKYTFFRNSQAWFMPFSYEALRRAIFEEHLSDGNGEAHKH